MPVTASPAEMNMAMMDFYYSVRAKLDEKLDEALRAAVSQPNFPESVSSFTELVYANREEFTADELAAASVVAEFATQYRFYGLGENGRGALMVAILRGEDVPEDQRPTSENRYYFGPLPTPPEPPEAPPAPVPPEPEGEGEE